MALKLTPLCMNCSGFHTGRMFGSNVRYFPKLRTFSYTLNQFPQTKQLLKSSHVAMKKKKQNSQRQRKGDEIQLKRREKKDNWRQNWILRRESSSFFSITQQQTNQKKKKPSRALACIQSISARSFSWCTGALTMATEGAETGSRQQECEWLTYLQYLNTDSQTLLPQPHAKGQTPSAVWWADKQRK